MRTSTAIWAVTAIAILVIGATAVGFLYFGPRTTETKTVASTTAVTSVLTSFVTQTRTTTSTATVTNTAATSNSSISPSVATTVVNTSSAGSNNSSLTANIPAPPANCRNLSNETTSAGVTIVEYLPASVALGQTACIYAGLQNNNQTTVSSISGNVTITDSSGETVFEQALVPFEAGSVKLATGQAVSFTYLWNTTSAYETIQAKPGTYNVLVAVQFDGLQPVTGVTASANITLLG